ncbi:methyl-accepting chemotaxis protein [Anabaena sp. UHCC 0204]|uniref:HAMP domain-containing methyl-accepting chemotaxis protein n=1 Tax=Anabaena sp. UHCC 0204 TaxID=2590009 RepID=UPI00144590F9|nr:methyl-accepting chemotaxis protein [Anabaena sp. UHCC 0204]MTJ10485.1 methyl-accepting chemotaxis protein [Anabaena sp. UHCC 0204]
MFKNTSLKIRLMSAFSSIAILVLFVGAVGWIGIYKLSNHINTLTNDNIPSLDGIGKIHEAQSRIDGLERTLLNPYITGEKRQATLAEINKTWNRIDEGLKQYESTPKHNNEEELYIKFRNEWDNWQKSHQLFMQWEAEYNRLGFKNPWETALELMNQGKANSPEMASVKKAIEAHKRLNQYSLKEGDIAFRKGDEEIFALLSFNQEYATLIRQESEKDVIAAIFFMATGILSCLIIAILLGMIISRQIANQVIRLVTLAEEISAGNLSTKITVDPSNKNEIIKLMFSFQYMTNNLSNLIRQIQQSGIQVTSSATQIAASGKQLETSITEQLASTNQVTVAAKEISATSRELVKTVEEVASLSQGTTVAASDSQKDLLQMETTMRQLVAATNSIAGRLGVISEKANNINNIVVTITKVADQTNLLSLNAAIEAEKAGEYGLGFAVVAREIRRLADQTAVATIDIEQMVKQMQSSVSTGVMEMDKFAAEVGRSVEDVGNISTQLGAIIDQVQELTPRYEAVSQGMEAQSQGASQISDAMSQLSSNSVQTAASLREINQAISQLNQVAQGLRQEMSRFQVNDVTEPYMEKSNRFLGDN